MSDDDNEWRDFHDAMKQRSQEKRAHNRENSAALLTAAGIAFESKNDGAHLIIKVSNRGTINFWPGTGLWMRDGTKSASQRNYGVRNLIHMLQGGQTLKRRKS